MVKKLVGVLAVLLTSFAMVSATGPASAELVATAVEDDCYPSSECYVHEAGRQTVRICPGGDCSKGSALVSTYIRQLRDISTGHVVGTSAGCSIAPEYNVQRVQVNRCALGIVGGVALAVNDTDVNGTTQQNSAAPATVNNNYVFMSTRHDGRAGFDLIGAGRYSVRWVWGDALTPDYASNSYQSNDFYCTTSPCYVFTFYW